VRCTSARGLAGSDRLSRPPPNRPLPTPNHLPRFAPRTTRPLRCERLGRSDNRMVKASYNRNLWMHHLNGDAAYLPV
jgi:hypothetical protein